MGKEIKFNGSEFKLQQDNSLRSIYMFSRNISRRIHALTYVIILIHVEGKAKIKSYTSFPDHFLKSDKNNNLLLMEE